MERTNKTFREIYLGYKEQSMAARQFIADVASKTEKTELTVRRWIMGSNEPDGLTKKVLAEMLGSTPDALFPNNDNNNNMN